MKVLPGLSSLLFLLLVIIAGCSGGSSSSSGASCGVPASCEGKPDPLGGLVSGAYWTAPGSCATNGGGIGTRCSRDSGGVCAAELNGYLACLDSRACDLDKCRADYDKLDTCWDSKVEKKC